MCQLLVYWMWSRGIDPDNAAIPYLTAVTHHLILLLLLPLLLFFFYLSLPTLSSWQIGDLLGTSLLALAFLTLESMGDSSLDNLDHHNTTDHGHAVEQVEKSP